MSAVQMKASRSNTVPAVYSQSKPRLFALWYFSALLALLTIFGRTGLGLAETWTASVTGVTTAILLQLLLEWMDYKSKKRAARFVNTPDLLAEALPSAIIPGLACAMLIYPNEHLWPISFAIAVSIGSKVLFRAPGGNGGTKRIFNPSDFGIVTTVLLFPWVGFAPPYGFSGPEGTWRWVLPVMVLLSGMVVHLVCTGRMLVYLAWLGGFALQAIVRHWLLGSSFVGALVPMTSAAFLIFTVCMLPDPATTPARPLRQAIFGFCAAMVYGVLQVMHIGFALFIALAIVNAVRGIALYALAGRQLHAWPVAATLRSRTAATGD